MDELIAKANIGRFRKALKNARDRDERRVFVSMIEAEKQLLRRAMRHGGPG